MRIAVCFFGIPRSLRYTFDSINRNILLPARQIGEVQIFAHFFNLEFIDNPRSGELGALEPNQHLLLGANILELEEPEVCLELHNFSRISRFGDAWGDGFKSLRNLIHQLHSLDRVGALAKEWGPDLYLFCRPDLLYHDCFSKLLGEVRLASGSQIWLPAWQSYGGLNDRFSLCLGHEAARRYASRVQTALDFCESSRLPLHSETLLLHAIQESQVRVNRIKLRASRMRSDGRIKREIFNSHRLLQNRVGLSIDQLLLQIGIQQI